MCKEIPLSSGRAFALVSDCDYERVSQYNWSLDGNGYAARNVTYYDATGKRRRYKMLLHRFVMDAPPGVEVDHKFHNRLDCRRSELRFVTDQQNRANSRPMSTNRIGYKGVSLRPRDGKYVAYISAHNRRKFLGSFNTPQEAAKAYDRAAYALFGEYAYLNFPSELHAVHGD